MGGLHRNLHQRHGDAYNWAKAVPVPPHGRLIDAEALEYEEAYLNGHYKLGDFEIVTREDIEKKILQNWHENYE